MEGQKTEEQMIKNDIQLACAKDLSKFITAILDGMMNGQIMTLAHLAVNLDRHLYNIERDIKEYEASKSEQKTYSMEG